jgi:hypothetical protein
MAELLHRADKRLYESKNLGKNRVSWDVENFGSNDFPNQVKPCNITG